MKKTTNFGYTAQVIAALMILTSLTLLTSCGNIRNRKDLATRMAAEEGSAESNPRIAELKNEIRSVDRQVEITIESVQKKGTYWRLLGLKYMDYKMWGEAASAFQEAIAITPDYAVLHYNSALCYARLALSITDPQSKSGYFNRSEAGYRRALVLDSRYTPAMYGLANLLIFELNRPLEAGPILQDYLAIERGNINGRFLLARVYLEAGRPSEALDLYDEIARIAKDPADVNKAENLYQRVAGGEYGS